MQNARRFHLVVAVVTTAAILFQLVLVVQGGEVLDEVEEPSLPVALYRFVAYFTIQSNVLVAVGAWAVVRDPAADAAWFRRVRLAGTGGITVTGVVHFVLLRPLLDLEGADWAADKLLHMVVPVLAVVGWAVFGPRGRIDRGAVVVALGWPIGWLVVTLVVGAASGWYPYPFLDPRPDGVLAVVVACVGVTALFLAVVAALAAVDERLPDRADSAA
ncbi:Pr6Pr family membrane protein [Nocardioides sp.]|uniref:Pr6Pr family membrane protein n=1 Tax=Nocardioides sp. TaxID=35761 RepID=UPI0027198DB7|nr:Pr6Pr family membrane protein [Nocardioides sp.]MDO9458247.1 Pr6Pr family membrane protein [Nocardioides sp.]